MRKIRCQGCNRVFCIGKFKHNMNINILSQYVQLPNKKEGILKRLGQTETFRFNFNLCGTCTHKIIHYFAQMTKHRTWLRYNELKFRKENMIQIPFKRRKDMGKKSCFWQYLIIPQSPTQIATLHVDCCQTNKESVITRQKGCRWWDENKKDCKIDMAIEIVLKNAEPKIIT